MQYVLTATEVLDMARKYKNYQEKRRLGTREQMWDFHWGAGSANMTIWAILYKEYSGANYQGQAWCAMYGTDIVALAFIEKYGVSVEKAAQLTKEYFGGDLPFNCQRFVNNHKNDSRMDHKPKAGDHVIFWTGAKYGHWGIVSGVDSNGKGFTSVEGNTSGGADKIDPDGGAVVEKWHSLTGKEYFYHPPYVEENVKETLTYYSIDTGDKGLRVTAATTLNIRDYPGTGDVIGTYKSNDRIYPIEKTFIDGKAWYRTDRGWISAMYVEGWVLENDVKKWWYVREGYTFTVRNWELIDDIWYYFDDTGYMVENEWVDWKGASYYLKVHGDMATSTWIKSIAEETWYWVDESGSWFANKPEYTTTEKPDEYITP